MSQSNIHIYITHACAHTQKTLTPISMSQSNIYISHTCAHTHKTSHPKKMGKNETKMRERGIRDKKWEGKRKQRERRVVIIASGHGDGHGDRYKLSNSFSRLQVKQGRACQKRGNGREREKNKKERGRWWQQPAAMLAAEAFYFLAPLFLLSFFFLLCYSSFPCLLLFFQSSFSTESERDQIVTERV